MEEDSGSKGCGETFPITEGIIQLYRGDSRLSTRTASVWSYAPRHRPTVGP